MGEREREQCPAGRQEALKHPHLLETPSSRSFTSSRDLKERERKEGSRMIAGATGRPERSERESRQPASWEMMMMTVQQQQQEQQSRWRRQIDSRRKGERERGRSEEESLSRFALREKSNRASKREGISLSTNGIHSTGCNSSSSSSR